MAMAYHFRKLGYRVCPFKAVNMSLNSVVVHNGEMSRAQWLQALAAGARPDVRMNPVLLKPEGQGSQVIVNGRAMGRMAVREYYSYISSDGLMKILESIQWAMGDSDIVVSEGAGSPAEINLLRFDLSNGLLPEISGCPIVMVGDIERGGVFASLYGTLELMPHRSQVKALVINRMRGDTSILEPGIRLLEGLSGTRVAGVVPFFEFNLPGEDSMDYQGDTGSEEVCVLRYPHMENYSEVDPLRYYGVGYSYVDHRNAGKILNARLVVLPGSKLVFEDLAYIRRHGIDRLIMKARERGASVLGVCGGYQILGKSISDPSAVQSSGSFTEGLGLLDVETEYAKEKTIREVEYNIRNSHLTSQRYRGYEIHYGMVRNLSEEPFLETDLGPEGAVSRDGAVMGTNVHGVLESRELIEHILGRKVPVSSYMEGLEAEVRRVSERILSCLDLDYIERLVL